MGLFKNNKCVPGRSDLTTEMRRNASSHTHYTCVGSDAKFTRYHALNNISLKTEISSWWKKETHFSLSNAFQWGPESKKKTYFNRQIGVVYDSLYESRCLHKLGKIKTSSKLLASHRGCFPGYLKNWSQNSNVHRKKVYLTEVHMSCIWGW